jgi:hypothetical protein
LRWLAPAAAGATLIAYEKHPEKGDVPIRIGVRLLRAAPWPRVAWRRRADVDGEVARLPLSLWPGDG